MERNEVKSGEFRFDVRKDGVPVLSSMVIDACAERMVRRLQPELFSRQIDRTDLKKVFCDLHGWHYAGKYLSPDGSLLGAAIFKGGRTEVYDEARRKAEVLVVPDHTILVDRALYRKEAECIFRFTMAHEIGHALLHERFCGDPENMKQYAEDTKEHFFGDGQERLEVREKGRLKTARDWVEWQANAFASAVLMPKTLVFKTADLVRDEEESEIVFLNDLCQTMTDVFKVSQTAAFYRLKELGIVGPSAKRLANGVFIP